MPGKEPNSDNEVEEQEESDIEIVKEGRGIRRSFTRVMVFEDGTIEEGGRFSARQPKQAACKALTSIVKEYEIGEDEVTFGIKETTKGSRNKTYWYNGSRERLEEPITLKIANDKKIAYNYNNVVKIAPEPECLKPKKGKKGKK